MFLVWTIAVLGWVFLFAVLFFLNWFYLYSGFRITEKLSRMCRDFLYTCCSHTCTTSPTINILNQLGTWVTMDKMTLLSPQVHSLQEDRPARGGVCSVGLDRCVMICIHHYSVIQSIFTALKILCALAVRPSLPWPPGNHWSFYCPHSFVFSRISHRILQYITFQIGFFHLVTNL